MQTNPKHFMLWYIYLHLLENLTIHGSVNIPIVLGLFPQGWVTKAQSTKHHPLGNEKANGWEIPHFIGGKFRNSRMWKS